MVSRKLYEAVGLACGFILIDYGFNLMAAGLPGAREFTSQFLGGNLILGGSAAVFISLYYLLKPAPTSAPMAPQTTGTAPDVGVETIVEEETPPKSNFYRNISYIGYFFTFLGLISAADLVLQVFIRSTYYEARWWVEILLVVFGVLSYTIFGSVGHLGAQEEARLTVPAPPAEAKGITSSAPVAAVVSSYSELLEVRVGEFSVSQVGEYERHLSAGVFDMFRIEREMVTIWREDRKGARPVYLAGPYELSRKLLEEHSKSEGPLRIGSLNLSIDSIHELLALQEKPLEGPSATAS